MSCKAETLRSIVVLACICAASPTCTQSARASIADARAVPLEPIGAIIEASRSGPIVAIGDSHGNAQLHAFRLALIQDPRVVDEIVVELGTARYQAVIDRFGDGGDVPSDELRKVWQDTTQIDEAWDLPRSSLDRRRRARRHHRVDGPATGMTPRAPFRRDVVTAPTAT